MTAPIAEDVSRLKDEPTTVERYYTVWEIAQLMKVSHMTVRRWFQNEPGVVIFGSAETRYSRKRTTMRIPESVFLRVKERMTVKTR